MGSLFSTPKLEKFVKIIKEFDSPTVDNNIMCDSFEVFLQYVSNFIRPVIRGFKNEEGKLFISTIADLIADKNS